MKDTAVNDKSANMVSYKLQERLYTKFKNWSKIKFTFQKENYSQIRLNDKIIPQTDDVKYLGIEMDR